MSVLCTLCQCPVCNVSALWLACPLLSEMSDFGWGAPYTSHPQYGLSQFVLFCPRTYRHKPDTHLSELSQFFAFVTVVCAIVKTALCPFCPRCPKNHIGLSRFVPLDSDIRAQSRAIRTPAAERPARADKRYISPREAGQTGQKVQARYALTWGDAPRFPSERLGSILSARDSSPRYGATRRANYAHAAPELA